MNLSLTVAPSILAFATTIHLGMVVLRVHRAGRGASQHLVSAISLLFAGSPWLMPSVAGLATGLIVHVGWFVACERLLAPGISSTYSAPAAARPPLAARPAGTGIAQAARQAQPRDFVNTPVMAVFDETPDIRTFRLARPDGFSFHAGQFLTVRLQAGGKELVRCYSISSSPGSQGYLEISVKRLGVVSSALHATLRPGSLLMVRPPAGSFRYPHDDQRGLVLLAGGVGITPLMSMLRHAVESDTHRPVTLFYSVRRVEDIAFNDELTLLAKRNEHVRIFVAVSEGPPGAGHFPGHISESLVTAMAPDVIHAVCMICGPQPMMEAMTTLLTSIGVPTPQIRFEVFQAAIAASSRVGIPATAPAGPRTGDDCHDISFERSGHQTRMSGSQTLLEAAEDCGADIPSLCRAGVCGTCRTRVISGETSCTSTILNDQDRAAGYVLACVTQVASACKVDA